MRAITWLLIASLGLAGGMAKADVTEIAEAPPGCEWRPAAYPDARQMDLNCRTATGDMAPIHTPLEFDPQTIARARSGDVAAMQTLWMFFYNEGGEPRDEALYLEWLRRAAEAGEAQSMHRLGVVYARGQGLAINTAEGFRWIKASAEAGSADGMAALGVLHAFGEGTPIDPNEAVRWFRAAAERGSVKGMLSLAEAYERGFGTARDMEAAARWRDVAENFGKATAEPSAHEMQLAYPVEAAAASVSGAVLLHCRVGENRIPANCSVGSEEPTGWGFAQAALGLSRKLKLLPGLAPGSQIRLPVRFKLAADPEPRDPTDMCAAYALALERTETLAGLQDWWSRYWKTRSRRLSREAGDPDTLERLAPRVQEAAERLAKGKDQGKLYRCGLR